MDVTIRCECPGEHVTDTVTFFDRLDFRRATIIGKALTFIENTDPATRPAEVLATLSEYYLLYGVQSWSIVGPDRKVLDVNTAAIRSVLLEHPDVSVLVEAATSYTKSRCCSLWSERPRTPRGLRGRDNRHLGRGVHRARSRRSDP